LVFENNAWDKWRIDHCNGRTSHVSKWISDKAIIIFAEECDKLITKKFIREILKEAKNAVKDEFRKQFLYQFNRKAEELAKKHAEEEVEKFMKGFKLSMDSEMEKIANAAMSGSVSETQLAIMETEIDKNV